MGEFFIFLPAACMCYRRLTAMLLHQCLATFFKYNIIAIGLAHLQRWSY